MSERLAPWRKWAWTSAGAMFLLLVVILYSVAQYLRAQRDRQIQQERIAHGEKMEALGQLTGGIAHDFANILGVLAGNLGVIRMLGGTDPRLLAALDRAQRAVKNGTTLTRQLMAFARKRPLQVREHDVNDAVSSTLTLLEQAAGPECRIVFDPGELPRPGLLDHTQLEMALLNLVLNARHAIEGSGRITISTRSVSGAALRLPSNLHARRYVCVSVADNGRGMPEEVLRRATEPLFTTKGEKGTGFGLAQVYGLMREVGGELSIASRVGEGTTVNLCFPEAAASGGTPRTVVAT
jgi:signal transduction histidine kinase